jgi:hypothetical protein
MNKLTVDPAVLSLPDATSYNDLASLPASEEPRRLIVLVPDSEGDVVGAARKIWGLANALGGRVQFLALCKDIDYEPRLRRHLVTLSAMVGDDIVMVETKLEFGRNWLRFVKANWHEGDVIVCFAEQKAGWMYRPLNQILASNINTTVYVINELYQTDSNRSNWISETLMWAGAVGIIAGFFWLQSGLIQMPGDWAHNTLMYFSVFFEVFLLWGWNSLFP